MSDNRASQIIQSAKSMAREHATLKARNAALHAGAERKDADLRELREALAKERRRFHWRELVVAFVICVVAAAFVWAGFHHG